MIEVNSTSLELLQRYNVQGPRYTSYPPAPVWRTEMGGADYEAAIESSNAKTPIKPLSLYLHFPFCESLCYFCGCHTSIIGQARAIEKPYVAALKKEIEWLGARVSKQREVVQLHFGGGTPTYSTPGDLAEIAALLRKNFRFSASAEMGLEADPRVTSAEHVRVLAEQGFNRLSFGVQDFDPVVQKAINRVQTFEETARLAQAAREAGYKSVNVDLVYGLPFQKAASFEKTIREVLRFSPDRLAVYSYAHVPWLKKHQSLLESNLPTTREKFDIFLTALRLFQEAGYEYIGMDHFAKPSDELAKARLDRSLWRNFMGYTTKSGTDLFGLGMSAIGHVGDFYFQNIKETKGYQEAVLKGRSATHRGLALSFDDKVRSKVIHALLCHAHVSKGEIEKEFSINFDDTFKEALASMSALKDDGLIEMEADILRPTMLGRLFLRNLAMPFDAYLPSFQQKNVFSKTL